MSRIHRNIIIYYCCIVKNKILRKHFIFCFILLLATSYYAKDTPVMRKTPPLCDTQNTAVSCKYFIGKIFYGYTKMYILVMITTQLCCMETNTNQE